jgi:hypothetical protein
MKTISDLKKGDMININGEIYQMISHSELPGSAKNELVIELGRLGEKNPQPFFRLIYQAQSIASMKLELFDKKTQSWLPQKLTKFGF